MARINICLLVIAAVIFCQTTSVLSRQIDLDYFDLNILNPQPQPGPTPSPSGATTTTTASPEFSNCIANCPALPQYNPVCGTNGVSYSNVNRLRCAQRCGLNIQQLHVGTCGRSPGGK